MEKFYEKRFCSLSIAELLTYPTIEHAAEAYAAWHDGNLPKEMLISDFIAASEYKFDNESDLQNAADDYAIWHDGCFPKEVLANNFKIASIYSKIYLSHKRNEKLNELGI